MKNVVVTSNEAGQRLDKLLAKYLNLAPKSFIYKMMRKKNITLNGKKCDGSERLVEGDEVKLFLADETLEKFSQAAGVTEVTVAEKALANLDIIYEDDHILLINKPAGMLSQKAKESDISLVEHVTAYLLKNGTLTQENLRTFHPAVCNRLDRNTSGLIVAGKSLAGLQIIAQVFKDRSLHKYYQCVVKGRITKKQLITGFLVKDERSNRAAIHSQEEAGGAEIRTEYEPIAYHAEGNYTLLKVTLLTGRSHQIRAHLASIGHPIVGDVKYGDDRVNEDARRQHGIRHQMLHSYQIVFPKLPAPLEDLSGHTFFAPLPKEFGKIFPEGR